MPDTAVKSKELSDGKVNDRGLLIYRGERLNIPDFVDCVAEVKTTNGQSGTFKIRDVSSFGIRVISNNKEMILVLNEIVTVSLTFFGTSVFEATAQVANEVSRDEKVSYGLSLVSAYLDIENIRAIISNGSHIGNLQIGISLMPVLSQVQDNFKTLVADLSTIFNEIKNRLEMEYERIEKTALNDNHKNRMFENALSLAVSLNIQTILELFNKFQDIVSAFTPEENSLHKKYFRLNFGEMIRRTPFLKRAFEKPLGYPGDYGLMVMFYNYEDLGNTVFDKFMHRLSCSQPVAVANQNRVEFLASLIEGYHADKKTENFKISSIACGPAQELAIFLSRINSAKKEKIEAILVDQEPRALDFAINSLKKISQKKCDLQLMSFKEDAVLGIIKERQFVSRITNSDVIVCAGLYDYLSDRVGGRLTEMLMSKMPPGGRLIIGNVSTEHPNKFSMEYFMEWNLVLRSPVQLLSLVPEKWRNQGGYSATVISESLGINLFLEICKDV